MSAALGAAAGLMDYVLADYTWARAVLLLGPTVATLGMTVQIPLATAADVVLSGTGLGHPHWMDSSRATLLTAAGTVAILAGVFGINCAGGSDAGSSDGSISSGSGRQAGQEMEHATEGGLQEELLPPGNGEEQQQHSSGTTQAA
jgi:solute carrier family 35 protein F5